MPLYRFYRVNKDGHISSPPEPLDCPDDGAAIAEAKSRNAAQEIEIWDLARIVARVEASTPVSVPMTRYQARLLRLKAEACRVLADISEDVTSKAWRLEQADHWQALATKIEREQLRKPAPTIELGEAWPARCGNRSTAAQCVPSDRKFLEISENCGFKKG